MKGLFVWLILWAIGGVVLWAGFTVLGIFGLYAKIGVAIWGLAVTLCIAWFVSSV